MYTIVSLSDSDKHFSSAIAEYTKRMQKDLTLIDLKPAKVRNSIAQAVQQDTETLLSWLQSHAKNYDTIVLLTLQGKDLTTENRVRKFPFEKKICFLLGGPHGLEEERLQKEIKSLKTLSLGKHTMVHGLAKLVLSEQIYRLWMIQHQRSYHY